MHILNSIKLAVTLTFCLIGQRLGDIPKIFTLLKFTTDNVSRLSHLLTLASQNNLNWMEWIEICFWVTGGNFMGGFSEEWGSRCWIKEAAEEVEAVPRSEPMSCLVGLEPASMGGFEPFEVKLDLGASKPFSCSRGSTVIWLSMVRWGESLFLPAAPPLSLCSSRLSLEPMELLD